MKSIIHGETSSSVSRRNQKRLPKQRQIRIHTISPVCIDSQIGFIVVDAAELTGVNEACGHCGVKLEHDW